MIAVGTAPYWLDYLARERTMCSICHKDGKGWVRIGPPIPPGMSTKRGVLASHRNRQRAAFQTHVAEAHPTLRVRWAR
jgi:hypothetical protein